jgi:hypothetical protein
VLVVDTAEKDYEFLVQRLRHMGVWAVARSMKRPPSEAYAANFFAGDFAVLECVDGDADDDDAAAAVADYAVPPAYRCHLDAERKTIEDLISSFRDGRRERQRQEQAASCALRHVFLVEGNVNELTGKRSMWVRNINSDIDHLVYASDIRVRQINTHSDLLATLYNMVRYTAKEVLDREAGIVPLVAYSLSGKAATAAKARDLASPAVIWSGMLQAVPGISPAAAEAITCEVYPTPVEFARDLVAAAESPERRAEIVARLREVSIKTQNSSSSRASTRFASRADKFFDTLLAVRAEKRSAPDSAPPPPKRVASAPRASKLWTD